MVDITTIKCPQCGSPSHQDLGNNTFKCDMCGASYVLGELGLTMPQEEGLYVASITTAYSKKQFLAKVLTHIADEDSPEDVFDCTVGQVREVAHQVYINNATADVSYSASIGYDRQEPYMVEEQYYDKQLACMRKRTVTKYKKVTEWQSMSNSQVSNTCAILEVGDTNFDSVLFRDNLRNAPEPEQVVLDASQYAIPQELVQQANSDNQDQIERDIRRALPGDHAKNFNCNIANYNSSESLWLTKEYEVDITYQGTTYIKHAFPFGNMTIGGDEIQGGEKQTDKMVWKKTKLLHFGTTALLILSLILSVMAVATPSVTSLVSILISYPVALAVFIVSFKVTNNLKFSVDYNIKQQKHNQLKNKLAQLGLEPTE